MEKSVSPASNGPQEDGNDGGAGRGGSESLDNGDQTGARPPSHPIQEPLLGISDRHIRLSIGLFLAAHIEPQETPEESYNYVRAVVLRYIPDSIVLSFDQVKRKVTRSGGIVSVIHDKCPNSCIAYTGPYEDLETCPTCGESRFGLKPPASEGEKKDSCDFEESHTIPLGPQLQAPESAYAMGNRHDPLDEFGGAESARVSQVVANPAQASAVPTGKASEAKKAKQATKLRPTKSTTARNLYAIFYMAEHPNATTAEFSAAYKNLDKATILEYEEKSRNLKLTAKG